MATRVDERLYRGMTAEERDADRRRRLVESATVLFGSRGYAATSITEVCKRAGVTARNFYDHFAGREELLVAVYESIVAEHAAATLEALGAAPADDLSARVRAGVGTAMRAWLADEGKARIAFLEVVGVSPQMEQRRLAVIAAYADILLEQIKPFLREGKGDLRRIEIVAGALVGGVVHVMTERLSGTKRGSVEGVVEELTQLFVRGLVPSVAQPSDAA